jgi:kynurenine 3-monooxygenase
MDKEQFILLINLISKTMDKKESIYSISRGILNRKMIDLAENAGAEFSLNKKIWDVTLSDATLHIGETERGGKIKRYGIWC